MKIDPFVGVGQFFFSDNLDTVKRKSEHRELIQGNRHFMGIKNPMIFIEEFGIDINFAPDGQSVDGFQLEENSNATFEGIKIFDTPITELIKFFLPETKT